MQHFFDNGTPSNATVANTSTKVLSKNSGRRYAVIVNDSNESMYVSLGTAAELNKGIRLNANGGVLEINGDDPFKGEIYAICSSGGKNITTFDA